MLSHILNLDIAKMSNSEIEFKSKLSQAVMHGLFDDSKKDVSPEGRMRRRRMMFRAIYGEFIGTTLFFVPIFASCANAYKSDWDSQFKDIVVGLVSGFHLICCIMCFSSISGANFNPAISFSLWLTGKLSNRKFLFYAIVQMLASLVAMFVVYCTFSHTSQQLFSACTVKPKDDSQAVKVFFTEFFCTFILTYVAFTMAFEEAECQKKTNMSVQSIKDADGLTLFSSTPQSKAGFAPFALGFVVFALSMYGGSSGVAMNPVRMFGPAVFAGVWDWFYLYWIAEFLAAGLAAWLVVYGPQSATQHEQNTKQKSVSITSYSPTISVARTSLSSKLIMNPISPSSSHNHEHMDNVVSNSDGVENNVTDNVLHQLN